MKYGKKKRELCGILFFVMITFLTAGCGGGSEEEELTSKVRGEVAAVLPGGETLEGIRVVEKERTRESIRYHVYCRINADGKGRVCEKCYLVVYRRVEGEWVCDGNRDVRLVEERN